MSISIKHQCIFIHIPKNGGTSVCKALELNKSLHYTYKYYQDRFPDEWESYFKFCIVRNPWSRLVSSYEYAKLKTSHWHNNVNPTKKKPPHMDYELVSRMTFKEVVELMHKHKNRDGWLPILRHPGWIPQVNWILDNSGTLTLDKIYKIEDLKELKDHFNVKLPKINITKKVDYRSYYDDETLEMVNDIYEKDITFLDYKFEL